MSALSIFVILLSLLNPGLFVTLTVAAPTIRDVDLRNPTHVRNVSIYVGSIGFSILFVVSMLAFLRVTAQTRPTRPSPPIHHPPYHTATTTHILRPHAVDLSVHPDLSPSALSLSEPSVAIEVELVELVPPRAAHTADHVRRFAYDASSGVASGGGDRVRGRRSRRQLKASRRVEN